ncbi:MAG: hypothetical protein ACTSVR_08410, partial [Candidatus Thorarchaeota archaeon]
MTVAETKVEAEDLLGDSVSANYDPWWGFQFYLMQNRPVFTYRAIHEILADPRIQFGLGLIKGPLQTHHDWKIESPRSEVEKFIREQLEWFWMFASRKALNSLDWGFSGNEVLYKENEGKVVFHDLKYLYAMDTRAVVHKGAYAGLYLREGGHYSDLQRFTYIGGPKTLWTVNERDVNHIYGRSRLFAAHPAYWEKWSEGGFRDVRRLWFYKNSFDSGSIYYPDGSTKIEGDTPTPNVRIAQQIVEQMRTGGVRAFPSRVNEQGKREWEYEAPKSNQTPQGLLEYGDKLDKELLEALGIPPEVVESQSSEGFGSSSGREIPLVAFFASLQEIFNRITFDFNEQILHYLIQINFGSDTKYSVIPKKLINVYIDTMNTDLDADGELIKPPAGAAASNGEVKPK